MDEFTIEEEDRLLLKVLGLTGAWEILYFLSRNSKGTHGEFLQMMNMSTLNMRLSELIEHKMIEHHLVRNPRREWYEITPKGREIFQFLLKILQVQRRGRGIS